MVNKKDTDEVQDELEITTETDTTETNDPELFEIENDEDNKLKTLKTKLKESEEPQFTRGTPTQQSRLLKRKTSTRRRPYSR
jgi:hypothetical protein